jgi:hypothetical protein
VFLQAPNNYLFGELVRVREKAHESEVAAQRLERRLSMAEDARAGAHMASIPRRAPRGTAFQL